MFFRLAENDKYWLQVLFILAILFWFNVCFLSHGGRDEKQFGVEDE